MCRRDLKTGETKMFPLTFPTEDFPGGKLLVKTYNIKGRLLKLGSGLDYNN